MNAPVEAGLQPYALVDVRDAVAVVTLNRGERFNALSLPMIGALETVLDALRDDPAVRVVVIAAKGRGFCAGHDLKEMRAHPDLAWQRELFNACGRMMQKLHAAAAAGHRPGPRDRDGGRMPTRVDVRPRCGGR